MTKPIKRPAFDVWIESVDRRSYSKIVFEPGGSKEGEYNLWSGWAIESRKGNWILFKTHLFEVICRSNVGHYEWLLGWMAQLLQDPGNKPGSAVILQGAKGTGKSTVAVWLSAILGDHAVSIAQQRHLIGNFNSHMMKCLLVNAEEGFWAGDKAGEGVLKDLITGSTRMLERKGVDPIPISNLTRMIATTNSPWAVPASGDERRFMVLRISDDRANDHAYFSALAQEFRNGGPEAMLEELLRHVYSHVNLRRPPVTDALVEQVEHSFSLEDKWWLSVLREGDFADADGSVQQLTGNWVARRHRGGQRCRLPKLQRCCKCPRS